MARKTYRPVPDALNARHSFTAPTPNSYPNLTAGWNGLNGWAPEVGGNEGKSIPTIDEQDRSLIHRTMPTPDRPPGDFYQMINSSTLERAAINEHVINAQQGMPERTVSGSEGLALNPYLTPSKMLRPTGQNAPNGYLMVARPGGIFRSSRHLTGVHYSMASNRRLYPLGGMESQRRFRNTQRTIPQPSVTKDVPVENGGTLSRRRFGL